MYKQIIIARKDLNMSPGKLAAQVSHGSMAFLTWMIRSNTIKIVDNYYRAYVYSHGEKIKPQYYLRPDLNQLAEEARQNGKNGFYAKPVDPNNRYGGKFELCDVSYHYSTKFTIDNDLYEQWIKGEFTKCVLQAKNKNQLLKAKTMAEEFGMKEGEDFFYIYDSCRTELEPEFVDENGVGRVLTCIGFKPFEESYIDNIGKKFHLYV